MKKAIQVLSLATLVTVLANCGGGLGDQIDRMGRPAVNTALNKTFVADTNVKDGGKDEYNRTDVAAGKAAYTAEVADNLAIYDALVGNCGDNAITATGTGAATYDALAGVLADDQLFVNAGEGTCTKYLAVETAQAGDCGGRTPTMDVIDVTYSVVAAGATAGVTDGVANDSTLDNDTFPFLGAPN